TLFSSTVGRVCATLTTPLLLRITPDAGAADPSGPHGSWMPTMTPPRVITADQHTASPSARTALRHTRMLPASCAVRPWTSRPPGSDQDHGCVQRQENPEVGVRRSLWHRAPCRARTRTTDHRLRKANATAHAEGRPSGRWGAGLPGWGWHKSGR